MTDYASQGKTRPDNVVELSHCRSHQSYYTALSRSATAAGTVIVQSFSTAPITGGASGYLRQEFRELEILNDITKLLYHSELPENINGHCRNILIRQYRQWKGANYVPPQIHPEISWSAFKPYNIAPLVKDSVWQIIKENKSNVHVNSQYLQPNLKVANGSTPTLSGEKRMLEDVGFVNHGAAKKLKPTMDTICNATSPLGSLSD